MKLQDLIDAQEALADAEQALFETKIEIQAGIHSWGGDTSAYFMHPDYTAAAQRVTNCKREVEHISKMPLEC